MGTRKEIVRYSFYQTFFGPALIASTQRNLFFGFWRREKIIPQLKKRYPGAVFKNRFDAFQLSAKALVNGEEPSVKPLPLHIGGTDFQMVVWKSLLRIPSGELRTYRQIATTIGKPTAWRAVASAIGNNPVAYLIRCHRVIRSDGHLGGYRWGIGFKQKMLDVEELKKNASPDCK